MMRQSLLQSLLLCLFALPAAAGAADDILAQAAADCASIDNGQFTALPAAVVTLDLTGDGQPETVVDTSHFQCTTSASYWGGTGGNWMTVLAGGQTFDYLAQGWQVIDWNGLPVLLLWHNGSECNGAGADPCVEALVWSDYQGHFMTTAAAGN